MKKHSTVEDIWNSFLTDQDKEVHAATGAGQRLGFGNRPALLIIDVSYNFLGEKSEPILDSLKKWRLSCGKEGWDAVAMIQKLLAACRTKRIPVIYSTGEVSACSPSAGVRSRKNRRISEDAGREKRGNEIVRQITPAAGEIVIRKLMPSAFFGTPLLGHLLELQVDSIIVTGTVTSNCVRATVVDAVSYNFLCSVVADACFDRIQASHAINLFDMNAKYADVVFSDEVLSYLASLPAGLFSGRAIG